MSKYKIGDKFIVEIRHGAIEPKQGKWIEVESYESEKHSVTNMRCNLCGKHSQMVLPHKTKCVYPRCPFCGAIMKGVDDEVR